MISGQNSIGHLPMFFLLTLPFFWKKQVTSGHSEWPDKLERSIIVFLIGRI